MQRCSINSAVQQYGEVKEYIREVNFVYLLYTKFQKLNFEFQKFNFAFLYFLFA